MTYKRPRSSFFSAKEKKDSKFKTALLGLKPAPIAELRKESVAFEKLMLERKAAKNAGGK